MQIADRTTLVSHALPPVWLMGGCAAIALSLVVPVAAETDLGIDASYQSWIFENGFTPPHEDDYYTPYNYFVSGVGDDDRLTGEFRNWFEFEIPNLPAAVASAQLTVYTHDLAIGPTPSVTYAVTSLPNAFEFSDVGTGTLYGSNEYTNADRDTFRSIELNAFALADIQASQMGIFQIGGRITQGLPSAVEVFAGSNDEFPVQLELTFVPEPASQVLLGLALVCLGYARRPR